MGKSQEKNVPRKIEKLQFASNMLRQGFGDESVLMIVDESAVVTSVPREVCDHVIGEDRNRSKRLKKLLEDGLRYQKLEAAVGEYYETYDDAGNEMAPKREGDLGDIGELVAQEMGYLM